MRSRNTMVEGRLLLHSVEAVCRHLVKQAAAATGGCTKANVSAMLFMLADMHVGDLLLA